MVAIPLIVGGVAALAFVIFRGVLHESSATVYINPDVAISTTGSSDPSAQDASVAAFVDAATSNECISQAAKASGKPQSSIRSATQAARVGSTNTVSVTVTEKDSSASAAAIRSIVGCANSVYTKAGLDRLQSDVQVYQDAYDNASNAVSDFVQSSGEASPEEHYNQIQQAIVQSQAGLNSATRGQLAALQSDLNRLQPLVTQYRSLVAGRVRAGNLLQDAQDRVLRLTSLARESSSVAGTSFADPRATSIVGDVSRYTVLGSLSGLAVGVAILLLLLAFSARLRSDLPVRSAGQAEEASEDRSGLSEEIQPPTS